MLSAHIRLALLRQFPGAEFLQVEHDAVVLTPPEAWSVAMQMSGTGWRAYPVSMANDRASRYGRVTQEQRAAVLVIGEILGCL